MNNSVPSPKPQLMEDYPDSKTFWGSGFLYDYLNDPEESVWDELSIAEEQGDE